MPSTPSFCTPGSPPRYLFETSLPRPAPRTSVPARVTVSLSTPFSSRISNTALSPSKILWPGWSLRRTVMTSPRGVTISKEAMLSMVVPYSKAKGPPEFSEMLPPRVEPALEAGSTVNSRSCSAAALMASRVMTPAWAVSRLVSGFTSMIFLKRARESTTERENMGIAPPVRPVPPPRGMTPKPSSLARRTIFCTCSVVSGNSTKSGSSRRRSVASVAHSMRVLAACPMPSSDMKVSSRARSSRAKAWSAS